MRAPSPHVLCKAGFTALLLFVFNGVVSSATAAEIVVENVKPPERSATVARYGLTREDCRRIAGALPAAQRIVPVREMPVQAVHAVRDSRQQQAGNRLGFRRLSGDDFFPDERFLCRFGRSFGWRFHNDGHDGCKDQ